MRLIECNVKGFGALNDFRISFDEGVNVVMQPNGWGKTTLAAFIKAMLYGFDSKRVRDVMQNERLRYAPWSGGVLRRQPRFRKRRAGISDHAAVRKDRKRRQGKNRRHRDGRAR